MIEGEEEIPETVINQTMAMEEVALVDKKLVTGKVVQFPVLVRVTIFSSTAAVDYSKKDEEVDRLSVFEYLVLSPLIAKKADHGVALQNVVLFRG
eukprot:scaffold1508_cov182-Ochromonas_danica.AAC.6